MTFPVLPHSGRKPHLWRLRREGFRELLLAKRWRMMGAYAEKTIARRTVMIRTVEEGKDYTVCCVQFKADFASELVARAIPSVSMFRPWSGGSYRAYRFRCDRRTERTSFDVRFRRHELQRHSRATCR